MTGSEVEKAPNPPEIELEPVDEPVFEPIDPSEVPNHDELIEILSEEGAPPRLMLDIGGSEDLNGDGFVFVSLNDAGDGLIFEDA